MVLVGAAGLELSDSPIADFFSLTMDQVADLSYYRPDAFRLDVDHLPDQQKAMMAANRAALAVYAGRASVRIIEDGGTTSGRLGMAEIVLAPHAGGPPQHRHARHEEGFHAVSGTVRFTSGEKSFDAPARTLVMVPPGAPHTFANPGDEPAIMLNTFTPDLDVQYFRDLRDLTADGRPPSAEQVAEVMARYATEPITGVR